jgi:hypothetical protein
VKTALATYRANLGFIVSDFVYQSVIKHGGGSSDPGAYTEVEVKVKEANPRGWIQVVDPALPALRARDALLLDGCFSSHLAAVQLGHHAAEQD